MYRRRVTARDLLAATRASPTPFRARTRGGVILRRTRAPTTTPPATYYNNASRPIPIISRLVPAARSPARGGLDTRADLFIRSVYRSLYDNIYTSRTREQSAHTLITVVGRTGAA